MGGEEERMCALYYVGYYQPQGGENSPRDTALSSHEHLLMHIPPGVYCPGELPY